RAHLTHLELAGVRTTQVNGGNLRVDHDLDLTRLHATGGGQHSVIQLSGAHLGGTLTCHDAKLTSTDGPALDANNLRVGGGVFLDGGFHAVGVGRAGVIRLMDAGIGGTLVCSGAKLSNSDGPALTAARLQVAGSLFMRDGFRATGAGEGGVIW